MAKVRYDIQPTKVKVGDLNCGDFFIYRDSLYMFATVFESTDEFSGCDYKNVLAILIDDDIDKTKTLSMHYETSVEPVIVEVVVKSYCK